MRFASSLLILISAISVANWRSQSDWSWGPGYPGPYHYWTKIFDTQNNMNWSSTKGLVYLEMNSTRHYIGGGVSGAQFVYPGDINGDGAIDVVASSSTGKKHVWFENDGTGANWPEHVVYSSRIYCYGAYPADIDGDNDLDIVGSSSAGSRDSIYWFENLDELGTDWETHLIDTSLSQADIFIGADIDGDLDNDVIAASNGNDAIVIWYENLDGLGTNWQKHDLFNDPDGFWVNEINSTDLDQDGDLDLLVAYLDYNGLVFCENETDTDTWSYYQFYTDSEYETPQSVDAGDLDGDGDIDVVIADGSPPLWGRVLWFENLDGSCESWERHFLEDSLPGVNSVHIADLTDDGDLDILVGSGCGWGEQLVFFYENIGGTGEYFARRDIDFGRDTYDVSSADIDNDGIVDLVTTNNRSTLAWISLEGELSGSLTSSIIDMWGYPEWLNFDWEGDGSTGTDMYFQVRGSNVPENMGDWSGNIYDPGSLAGYLDSTYRYIQYSVTMESDGPVGSPVLSMVTFEYDNLGIEEEEQTGMVLHQVTPNPASQTPTLSFVLPESCNAVLSVYDLTGREVFKISDEWPAGESSVELSVPTTGTYFARLRSGEENHLVRFVVLSE